MTHRHFDSLRLRAVQGAACAALLMLAACGEKTPAPTPAPAPGAPEATAPAASPTPAPAPAAPTAADATQKMNTYVACFNDANGRAHQAMSRYSQWGKDMAAGPTGQEKVIYGVYTVSEDDLKDCDEPVGQAAAAQPAMPQLDEAALAYSKALQAWGVSLLEADPYYSREDYKDDQMAKGKAMHAGLVANYEAFDKASAAFGAALEAEADKRQAEQLAAIEKAEGRQLAYWHLATMSTAKALVNAMTAETVDVDAGAAKLKAYEDAMNGLLAYSKQEGVKMPIQWSFMSPKLESFLVSAKQRLHRVRDNTPYSTGEQMNLSNNAGWMVEGSPDRVVRDYNELVEASSRL